VVKLLLKREGVMRRKLILGTIVLALVMLGPLSCAQPKSELEIKSVPFITDMEVRDPETALQYGILGYVDILLPPDAPETIHINRGETANITILLHFVSHIPELTEVEVNIDPKHSDYTMQDTYVIGDAQGNVIGKGVIKVNEIISYSPNETITMEANQTLPITMMIRVPADLPDGIMRPSFHVNALGITASVSAVDNPDILSRVPPEYREDTMDIPAIGNVFLEVTFDG